MEANLGAHGANQRRGARPTLQSEEGGGGSWRGGFLPRKDHVGTLVAGPAGWGPGCWAPSPRTPSEALRALLTDLFPALFWYQTRNLGQWPVSAGLGSALGFQSPVLYVPAERG